MMDPDAIAREIGRWSIRALIGCSFVTVIATTALLYLGYWLAS